MERLQKVIATSGLTSRRKAEDLIKAGRVKVNNVIVRELGTKVTSKDIIKVDDKELIKEKKVYYLLNKPRGIITSVSDDKERKTVVDLIPCNERIYPVGRLDYDTTGVLILTNDGDFANILMHPSSEVEKVYIVKVKGIIDKDAINTLKNGVIIDGKMTKQAKIKLRKKDYKTNTSMLTVTIHEGRNHQVKKMFESVGYKVLKLKREREFIFDLKGLKSGEYRTLTPKEVAIVYSLKTK
mgnify:CR=1 FL=1